MGYRKAAMMRRPQYVRGHYRTSKTGKTYWVGGHSRNGHTFSGDWIAATLGFIGLAIALAQAL